MTIENDLNEQLKSLRAKNVPVTLDWDGPVVGELNNIRVSESSSGIAVFGNISLTKEQADRIRGTLAGSNAGKTKT